MERSVKAVELTFKSVFTRTHEVGTILSSLPPDSGGVRQSLLEAWSSPASFILHSYANIMYKGLNNPTGEDNNRNWTIYFY